MRPPTRKKLFEGKWRSREQVQKILDRRIDLARQFVTDYLDEGRADEAPEEMRRAYGKLGSLQRTILLGRNGRP